MSARVLSSTRKGAVFKAKRLGMIGIPWAMAVGIAAFAYPVSRYRRKEHGPRQAGGRDPSTTV